MNSENQHHLAILQRIALQAMIQRGLRPDFSPAVLAEVNKLDRPAALDSSGARDLRSLLWCSVDNDDSRDLDQLTACEALPNGAVKVLVAIADVDALVHNGSAIDQHARFNTTSVYTAAQIFPMLPEKISTDLTSLNFNQPRLAVVVEMVINPDGIIQKSDIYTAQVLNKAKLAYNSVAAWLEDEGEMPEALAAVKGLAASLRLQDRAAQKLKHNRFKNGALNLETIKAMPVFDGELISGLRVDADNRAKDIIADFMIAANGVTARYLAAKDFPSIRRVVRTPKRWDRIVEIAAQANYKLPAEPDSAALDGFLSAQKAADPVRFPDLSLTVIKLLGNGEYQAEMPDETSPGHFGLAVLDYGHSTAPNRRYPDLITQRLLKAAIAGKPVPYNEATLDEIALRCTLAEDQANKVERQVDKSAAALLLENRIGEQFEAVITGASSKGTWARVLSVPVEGRVEEGYQGLDVGERVRVQLLSVDVQRGFIDFRRVNNSHK